MERYSDNCVTCLIFPATAEEKRQHGKDFTWVPVFDSSPRPLWKEEELKEEKEKEYE